MSSSAVRAVLRLASRDAWRHRGRSALIVLTLAFPVAGLVAAATLIHALTVPKAVKVTWTIGNADVLVGTGQPDAGAHTEQSSQASIVAKLPVGSKALAFRTGASRAGAPGGLVRQVDVSDLAYTNPLATGMVHQVSGRAPRSPEEVTVSAAFASAAHVRVGSRLSLQDITPQTLTVVGIAEQPDSTGSEQVWVAPGEADVASAFDTQVLATLPPGSDQEAVAQRFANQGGAMLRDALLAEGPSPVLRGTQQVGLTVLVVGLALLEAILMAGAAFAVGARRSQRDLALVGAAGGDAGHVRAIVLSGGAVLGAVGGIAGTAIGLVIAEALLPYAPRYSHHIYAGTHPRVIELVGTIALGLATGLVAAWLPARGASRAPIMASLTGRRGVVRSRASMTWLAIGAAVFGTLIAAWAGRTTRLGGQQINGVLFGAAVAELGFAGCAPALVGLAGRLASRAPLAARLSLRDIARHRTRTGPAVAAIMATLSGVVAMGVYVASTDARSKANYTPSLPTNVVSLSGVTSLAAQPHYVTEALSKLPVKAQVPYLHPDTDRQAYLADWGSYGASVSVVDPALLTALGEPAAAQALTNGAVVVARDRSKVLVDSTVRVAVGDGLSSAHPVTSVLPAVASRLTGNYEFGSAFISQATARKLGLDDRFNNLAFVLTGAVKSSELDAARSVLLQHQPPTSSNAVYLEAETGRGTNKALLVPLALLVISALVTFGVTAISTALSASEGRPDLATLGAVGATPLLRRRLAMTQAAVLALLGGVLGILAGLVPMAAVIAVRSDVLTFTIPWQVIALSLVGVPVLAGLGAAVFTRSSLPLVRRLT